MTDYSKILLENIDIDRLYNLPYLDFKSVVNLKTGELSKNNVAHYHFCKITIYDNRFVLFTGSIHKLFNSLKGVKAPNYKHSKNYKGFNGNLFTLENCIEVRRHLGSLFNCTSSQMIFQNIEFGINTSLKFNPQLFITGLLCYGTSLFEYRYKEHFAIVVLQRYSVKIYNKSNQYGMANNTLRFELKFNKSEDLKKLNIRTFKDINASTLEKALKLLLKCFDKIIYYDNTFNLESLNTREKRVLERYSNPRFWKGKIKRQKKYDHKIKLIKYIDDFSENLHKQIRIEIKEKGYKLTVQV